MIKVFFRGLRLLLKPLMLIWAKLGMPKGIKRPAEMQQRTNIECAKLTLYHFPSCPFCIKVRREMARLSLPIQLRDAQNNIEHRSVLLQSGGKIQTPCLRIENGMGSTLWMYESSDIIDYLRGRFG